MTKRLGRGRSVTLVAALLVGGLIVVGPMGAVPAGASAPDWVHQLGSSGFDAGQGAAVDGSGNLYVAGFTAGTLPGSTETNAGGDDAFLAKYDAAGTQLWVHQLGSTSSDGAGGVAVDGSGNAYVTGYTQGTLPGSSETNAGGTDAFLAKYDPSGTKLWVHQLGSGSNEQALGVAVDGSANVYLTGYTQGTLPGSSEINAGDKDIFVAKYDTAGTKLWVHQLGSPNVDQGLAVAVDGSGDVYLGGFTLDTLPGSTEPNAGCGSSEPCTDLDVFVAKYDTAGTKLWVHQLGTTGRDSGLGVAVDGSGNLYVTGSTDGTLPGSTETNGGNGTDVFLAKYDTAGTPLWVHQLGVSPGSDAGLSVAVGGSSNVYVSGYTAGTLPGSTETYAGGTDAFLARYNASGAKLWVHQLGSTSDDVGQGVAVDGSGNVYVTGYTMGTLPGSPETNAGISDVFVAKYGVSVPVAPTVGAGLPGNGSVSVAFTPSDDGGSAVLHFDVECTSTDDGVSGSGSGAASPIVVSGLTNGSTYTCTVTATNAVGTSGQSGPSSSFIVGTAPDAPTIGTVILSGTTAIVPFTAPSDDGGSAITSYAATCTSSNGGTIRAGSGATSPVSVATLTPGKTYTCTVRATNARGMGPASAPSNAVTVANPPGAPTGVKAVSGSTTVATGSLVVTFTAPASNGGSVITSFTATCTSTNGGVTKAGVHSGATAAPITVGTVTTGKTYVCTVKAANAVGTGAASAPSLPVIVGSPAASTNVKAVSGLATTTTGSLTVTFTIGANNGSAITSQTATCVSSNGGVTKTGVHSGATAAPISVAGTSTAKTYTCTVKVNNARGAGLASTPSLPVIVGSPAPPTGVTAIKVASGHIRVTFTPGASNGSATTSYTATCTSSNGGVVGSKAGAPSPLTVTGLTAAKTYTCTVKGANSRGAGLSSAPSGAVIA